MEALELRRYVGTRTAPGGESTIKVLRSCVRPRIQDAMSIHTAQERFLIEVQQNEKIVQYVAASMLALIGFDICIFFDDEFDFVWKARRTWGKALYLFIRYGTLLITVSGLYGSLYVNPSSATCRMLTQVYTTLACILSLSIKVTQLLRAAALYGDSWRKKVIICVSSILQFVVLFALSIMLIFSYRAIKYPFRGFSCALSATFPRPIYLTFYAFTIAPDLIICATCAFKIFQLWAGGESSLAWIMFRDILAYMLILTLMAIPQFLTPLFLPAHSTIIVTGLNFAILSVSGIASCRMVLNMRSYILGQPDVSLVTMAMANPTTASISQIDFDCGGVEAETLGSDGEGYEMT